MTFNPEVAGRGQIDRVCGLIIANLLSWKASGSNLARDTVENCECSLVRWNHGGFGGYLLG